MSNRDQRQQQVFAWTKQSFGEEHATSMPQRALRMLEEAIELYQACGADLAQAHKLLDFVFSRPVGGIAQELGGVGVTVLALAAAAGVSADLAEGLEIERVLSFPAAYFNARNRAKNAAGFDHDTSRKPSAAAGEAAPFKMFNYVNAGNKLDKHPFDWYDGKPKRCPGSARAPAVRHTGQLTTWGDPVTQLELLYVVRCGWCDAVMSPGFMPEHTFIPLRDGELEFRASGVLEGIEAGLDSLINGDAKPTTRVLAEVEKFVPYYKHAGGRNPGWFFNDGVEAWGPYATTGDVEVAIATAKLNAEGPSDDLRAPVICNTCGSKHGHLHPAMQYGGEVQVCRDDFHRAVTPQNTRELIRGAGLEPILLLEDRGVLVAATAPSLGTCHPDNHCDRWPDCESCGPARL